MVEFLYIWSKSTYPMEAKELIIQPTVKTPGVHFDPIQGIFSIFGQSYPEDAGEVFDPIIDWISKFEPEKGKKYIVRVELKYYNTATSKKLFEILRSFNKFYKNDYLFTVQWVYTSEDEDILESVRYFDDLTEMPFEYIQQQLPEQQ